MQYIQLSDSSFILHTTKGAVTVNRTSFNFTRIKAMLDKGTLQEYNLLPLLEPPELPDGVFELYESITCKLVYKQTRELKGVVYSDYKIVGTETVMIDISEGLLETLVFLGVYASVKDIMFDYPEYFI
jgi:hypothetical protein